MTLVSIAEQEGSSLNWSPTPEDRFSQDVAHIYIHVTITMAVEFASDFIAYFGIQPVPSKFGNKS